ncbi:hypothetical protein GCM10020229_66480 [Kitasatospora albolonga]
MQEEHQADALGKGQRPDVLQPVGRSGVRPDRVLHGAGLVRPGRAGARTDQDEVDDVHGAAPAATRPVRPGRT